MFGTRHISAAARGIYVDLLCISWDKDGLPENPESLLPHLAVTKRQWERLWPEIADKWVHAEDGKLRNPRQERIRAELQEFRKHRSEAGKKGAEKRWHSHD